MQAPVLPATPGELEALLVREMGPRPPPGVCEPMQPRSPRSCRFHPRVWSVSAVFRGARGNEEGWVLLCPACSAATTAGTLEIVGESGLYRGHIPRAISERHPFPHHRPA